MSEAFVRVLNAHTNDTEALLRLWETRLSNADDNGPDPPPPVPVAVTTTDDS